RTHDGDALVGRLLRRKRLDPTFVPRAFDNLELDLLDGDRIAVDTEHARGFTWRRAQPPGEFREIVRRVQAVERVLPTIAVHEIVEIRDDVAQRTAVIAE